MLRRCASVCAAAMLAQTAAGRSVVAIAADSGRMAAPPGLPVSCLLPCGEYSVAAVARVCAGFVVADCGQDASAAAVSALRALSRPVSAQLDAGFGRGAAELLRGAAGDVVAARSAQSNSSRPLLDWRSAGAAEQWSASLQRTLSSGVSAVWVSESVRLQPSPAADAQVCTVYPASADEVCATARVPSKEAELWAKGLAKAVTSAKGPLVVTSEGSMSGMRFSASGDDASRLANRPRRDSMVVTAVATKQCDENLLTAFLVAMHKDDVLICDVRAAEGWVDRFGVSAIGTPVGAPLQTAKDGGWTRKFTSGTIASFNPSTGRGTIAKQVVPVRVGMARNSSVLLRGGSVVVGNLRQPARRNGQRLQGEQLHEEIRRIRRERIQHKNFESLMFLWFLLVWVRLRQAQAAEGDLFIEQEDHRESTFVRRMEIRFQMFMDRLQPRMRARYVILASMYFFFALRIYNVQGFYAVVYGLGIYQLNLLILFLRPANNLDSDDERPQLLSEVTAMQSEYRPFQRKLPEYKAWYNACKSICVCYVLTFFRVFDIPVFWPVLVVYFVFIFAFNIQKQVRHMWKHQYVPWSTGEKKKFAGGEDAAARARRSD
eukprot:TRINITY_DN8569_c0_g2_i1.p1 TRINITY_DN8569_c0_g2~~TRINITY_DN8569_c0_g2_i1.p1  ORF type:complete len:602 (+),score=157.76 TRINITY_DN8569_c0_g2_i1:134-1939(+)